MLPLKKIKNKIVGQRNCKNKEEKKIRDQVIIELFGHRVCLETKQLEGKR
jgi:hypothetical protein